MPTSINSSPKSTNFNIRMGRRKKMSNTKLTHSTDKEGKNQNLWPDLPQQLIGLIARNSSMMKDVYSKGVTKSWRSAESRKCRPISLTPLWLELSADYGDDHGRSHTFNIPFKVGYIWYWTRNRQRPNLIGDYHFLGFSRGLLVAKAAKDSANYTLLDPHPYRGGWNMPLWDADVPFLSASLSAFPLTSPRTRTQAKAKSIVMVLTGISNPAFLYYRVWEDKTWVKKASTMVDPHCCDPNEQDHLLRFGNGIWLKGKFYALSLAGTVAVIEDIGDDVRVTAIGKRIVPSGESLHYRECMIESRGKILLVFLISRNCVSKVDFVEVYELNAVELTWIKKERLGDLSLFLGVHCCMGVSARRVGWRGNCIYFSINYGNGWLVYDMETCIFSPLGTTFCETKFLDWADPELE